MSEERPQEFPAELRPALVRREPEALARFFDFYFDRVFAYVQRLVGDEHLAEDLTQDVFVNVQRALPMYDPKRDPRPWVFAIATNRLRDHWRARGVEAMGSGGANVEQDELAQLLPAPEVAPDGDLARTELADRVRHAIERLPEGLRATVLLRAFEGLSFAEIGRIVERDEVAVRKRYSRALGLLRGSLGDAWRTQAEGSR
jgi:RNA polymerase sigma-70 factor (ECF subfamily)